MLISGSGVPMFNDRNMEDDCTDVCAGVTRMIVTVYPTLTAVISLHCVPFPHPLQTACSGSST